MHQYNVYLRQLTYLVALVLLSLIEASFNFPIDKEVIRVFNYIFLVLFVGTLVSMITYDQENLVLLYIFIFVPTVFSSLMLMEEINNPSLSIDVKYMSNLAILFIVVAIISDISSYYSNDLKRYTRIRDSRSLYSPFKSLRSAKY
jgi:putative effector of murein hydrolase LrgA (UPF0299 family)